MSKLIFSSIKNASGSSPNLVIQTAFFLCLLLSFFPLSQVSAGGIYKSVDANGNVIFTDQPLEGAETLEGTEPEPPRAGNDDEDSDENTQDGDVSFRKKGLALTPDPINPPKPQPYNTDEPKKRPPVTVVEILTPIHDATLQDPIGKIWVELQSYPTPLKDTGLTAQLWMDGEMINSGQRPMLSLAPPERGTHVLVVKLVDENGRLFLQSNPTHIHVKYRVAGQ